MLDNAAAAWHQVAMSEGRGVVYCRLASRVAAILFERRAMVAGGS